MMQRLLLIFLFTTQTIDAFGEPHVLLQLAEKYYERSIYDSSYFYGTKCLENPGIADSIVLRSAIVAGLSAALIRTSDTTDYLYLARQISIRSGLAEDIIATEYAYGKWNFIKMFYADALPYFLKVDSVSQKAGIVNNNTIDAHIHRAEISRLAFNRQSVNVAYDLMIQALAFARQIRSEAKEHLIYMYLSDLEGLRENYAEAKRYADLAIRYYLQVGNIRRVSRVYWIYTAYYTALDQPDSAAINHKARIEYLEQTWDQSELASAIVAYGNFLRKNNQCDLAIPQFKRADNIYNKIGENDSDRYVSLLTGMGTCYAQNGDNYQAFKNFEKAYQLKVKLSRQANNELTRDLETKYQARQKDQQIALLSARQLLADQENRFQRNLFLIIISMFLMLGGMMFFAYRNKLRTATRQKELDELKSRFFANISHEFRTPLTLIKSPIQSVMSMESAEEKLKKLQLAEKSADQMLSLVDQLLELSKLDSGKMKLILKRGDITRFLHSFIEPFEYEAAHRQINFKKELPESDHLVFYDQEVLEKIIGNLLSNAIKYTPENHNIAIHATINSAQLNIRVSNDGINLTPSDMSHLFERFYQKNLKSPGAGIGLALTNELVTLYHGKIKAETIHDALTIKVTIPLSAQQLPHAVVIEEAGTNPGSGEREELNTDHEKPVLLIVDDNKSVRLVVRDIFSSDFNIMEAEDASQAFAMAKEAVPDIVISDVMMPGPDGYELTAMLRNDEVTSFIPVALLTARSGDDDQLKSMLSNADAFITKPFDNEILKAKVNQLLRERQRWRERYSHELVLKPMDLYLNSAEEKFINRLQGVIDKSISDPDFSAVDFAQEIGMSRMQLHRKLKSLFNMSATEFVRTERLKLAKGLLEQGADRVSDVAYAVGFNDVSYFAKCFKDMYGVPPSHYTTE